jgi:hypothetical protein
MSSIDDFKKLQPTLTALPVDQVMAPNMPVHLMVQEAENLYHWATLDKEALVSVGLDVQVLEDIQPASGALRYAEGEWYKVRFSRADAQKQWSEESPWAFDLRNRLVHDFLFALRNDEALLTQVRGISDGNGNADMIQDLIKLRALGLEYVDELKKINFDVSLLEKAAETADRMGNLLGVVSADSPAENDARDLRDRAFTHLKKLVGEVREYGKYVFYRNEERYRGYVSKYFRRANRTSGKTDKPAAVEEPVAA